MVLEYVGYYLRHPSTGSTRPEDIPLPPSPTPSSEWLHPPTSIPPRDPHLVPLSTNPQIPPLPAQSTVPVFGTLQPLDLPTPFGPYSHRWLPSRVPEPDPRPQKGTVHYQIAHDGIAGVSSTSQIHTTLSDDGSRVLEVPKMRSAMYGFTDEQIAELRNGGSVQRPFLPETERLREYHENRRREEADRKEKLKKFRTISFNEYLERKKKGS